MIERIRVALRISVGTLVLSSAAYLVAFRRGTPMAGHVPLLWSAGALLLLLAAMLVLAVRAARGGSRRVAAIGEAVAAAGLICAAGFGFANWAIGFRGTVVLLERAPVNLSTPGALLALSWGPLTDDRERDVTVALARLRLEGVGPDGFRAVSQLRVLPKGGEERGVTLSSREGARVGSLLLNQGAFGFAPRVVILRGGKTLLDTHVPFRTVREGVDGVAFVEDFEVTSERLLVHGAVALEDLNDDMKGHPKLELAVEREGAPIGSGTLRPGEFVDLRDGLRVGFAGLQRWSELVIARTSYRVPVLASGAVAALGAMAWAIAAWRRW